LKPDPQAATRVQAALGALTGDRPVTGDELALRETLRDMLGRVALVRRTAAPPALDGRLDDACWKDAQVLTDFFKFSTTATPKYRTEVRMAYDDKCLYVAFVGYQDKKMLYRETGGIRDDRVWCDDAVEFFLNRTDAKEKQFYQAIINPWGDIFDQYNEDAKFNADMTIRTEIQDDRFTIEAAIAWAGLPDMKPSDRFFRMNVQRGKRTRAAYEEVSSWFPNSQGPGNLNARGWMVLAP
jgi:hypothetical protein